MPFIPRAELESRLRANIQAGIPIVGAGAGTGISAKMAEAGGADMAIIYNSGRYRMAGRGSLAGLMAYGDANGIVVEMAAEVLPVVKHMDTGGHHPVTGVQAFEHWYGFLTERTDPHRGFFQGVVGTKHPHVGRTVFRGDGR